MNWEDQLKVQAFLDGQLPPDEAETTAAWIQRDPAAAALLAELRGTRQAVRLAQGPVMLAESREFYWSKIAQDIARSERRFPIRSKPGLLARLRILVLPIAALVVLVVVGISLRFHTQTAPKVANGVPPQSATNPKLAITETTNTILVK